MDDLISRQDVIDLIDHYIGNSRKGRMKLSEEFIEGMEDGYFRIRSAILGLPSAERKGNWIVEDIYMSTKCSICGFTLENWMQGAFYNYCPNCGADMRGEQDG